MTNQFVHALKVGMQGNQACCTVIGLAQIRPAQSGALRKMVTNIINRSIHATHDTSTLILKSKQIQSMAASSYNT
jgi:hypothetical protein